MARPIRGPAHTHTEDQGISQNVKTSPKHVPSVRPRSEGHLTIWYVARQHSQLEWELPGSRYTLFCPNAPVDPCLADLLTLSLSVLDLQRPMDLRDCLCIPPCQVFSPRRTDRAGRMVFWGKQRAGCLVQTWKLSCNTRYFRVLRNEQSRVWEIAMERERSRCMSHSLLKGKFAP